MRHKNRSITIWTTVALLFCATFSTGCEPSNWFGSNFSVNVLVPMGLGGTPGLLNPFGIVQAMVNALIGSSSSSDSGDGGDGGVSGDAGGDGTTGNLVPPAVAEPAAGVFIAQP